MVRITLTRKLGLHLPCLLSNLHHHVIFCSLPLPCYRLSNSCYKCGSTNLFCKDYPQKLWNTTRPITQGRIFNLDEPSAIATLAIIQGTLSIHNSIARALINTHASHSFISCIFTKNLDLKPKSLWQTLIIETPFRGLLEAYIIYKNCKVKVSGKELTIDLILLDFLGFNVILGMDWLENY